MSKSMRILSRSRVWLTGGVALVVLGVGALATGAQASTRSLQLHGSYSSHPLTQGCTSPVGFCLVDQFRGTLTGPGLAVTNSISPTPDPGVGQADTTIVIHDPRGDLTCRAQSVFNSAAVSASEFAFICEVTGGTRRFAGASGFMVSSGFIPPGSTEYQTTYGGRIALAR